MHPRLLLMEISVIGLNYKDFYTVVAYENGMKVATQELILDAEFYKEWIDRYEKLMTCPQNWKFRIISGSLIELKSNEEIKSAKKGWCDATLPQDLSYLGFILGETRSAVTIGTFSSIDDSEFVHYAKVADHIRGRYYLAYTIKAE